MTSTERTDRRQMLCRVVDIVDLAPSNPDHFKLTLESSWLADNVRPGQFIHLIPPSSTELLRRPFSILSADKSRGHLTILFRVIGEGTSLLSDVKPGEKLDVIGPLGNGFPVDLKCPAILAGGGVGIPPLVHLANEMMGIDSIRVFPGSRDTETLLCVDDFRVLGIEPVIATEDGSVGVKGFITDAMNKLESIDPGTVVYSCGPIPMLSAIAKWSADRKLKCYVSLENKLGCGIGACLGCSVPIREKNGTIHYERVCVEGPVFDASRVAFDLM